MATDAMIRLFVKLCETAHYLDKKQSGMQFLTWPTSTTRLERINNHG